MMLKTTKKTKKISSHLYIIVNYTLLGRFDEKEEGEKILSENKKKFEFGTDSPAKRSSCCLSARFSCHASMS